MLVRMDAATFASESSQVGSAARKVQQATSSLASSLNGCAGMAGIDPMAEEFANGTPEQGGYDASMTAMLKGGTTLAQAVAAFEAHVLGLAAAYRAMELAGAEPASNRYAGMTATTISGSAPHAGSALGDEGLGTPGGEIMEWIENFLKDTAGIVIPTADTGKVTTAASAWSTFSSDLTAASSSLSASLPATLASEFPQSGAVSAARDKLVEMLDGLSTDAGAISAGCTDYANNVEAIRGELRAMLGQLALEVAIDIGVGVALSFFSFGAGALAGIAKAATTVARWIPKLLSVINRLKALIQTSKRLMALMRRAAIEAIESTVSGTVASAGASLAFGNFSWSGLGGAALSSGIGGVVSGPFSHIGSTMTSRGPRLLVTGGVGAVTGAGGGVAGEWAASQVSGQEFNLLVSALVGAGGGAAGGSLGNIKTPASSSTPSVDVSAPNTTPATASVGANGTSSASNATTTTTSDGSSSGAPTPVATGGGGAATPGTGGAGGAGGSSAPSSTAPTGTGGSAGGSASTSTANPASVPDGHVDTPTHLDIDQPSTTASQSSDGGGTPVTGDATTTSTVSQPSNTDTTSTDVPTTPGDTDATSTTDIDRQVDEFAGNGSGSTAGASSATVTDGASTVGEDVDSVAHATEQPVESMAPLDDGQNGDRIEDAGDDSSVDEAAVDAADGSEGDGASSTTIDGDPAVASGAGDTAEFSTPPGSTDPHSQTAVAPRRDPSILIDASPEGQEILAGSAQSGPGWTRVPDAHLAEPNYGKPIPNSGHLEPKYLAAVDSHNVATDVGRAAQLLRLDPAVPYGRDGLNGPVHDVQTWEARNVDPAPSAGGTGELHFSPNQGAVIGTRVRFHDLAEFRRIFGNLPIDRLGDTRGTYLGIGGGTFDERALPPGQVGQKSLWDVRWQANAALPRDHVIEISVVGDAYGRPGGALQMVVLRPDPANPGEMEGVSLGKLQEFLFDTEDWFPA